MAERGKDFGCYRHCKEVIDKAYKKDAQSQLRLRVFFIFPQDLKPEQ